MAENFTPKFDIDIGNALKSGYTEAEIAKQVADLANTELKKTGQVFDYEDAKNQGVTDADILRQFGRNVSQETSAEYQSRRMFEGFAESGGGLGGMIRGGQLGLMATAAIPIPGARVVGALVGGLGGMILGNFLGGKAADIQYSEGAEGVVDVLTGQYERPEAVPEMRPAGERAYTIGAIVPYAATPWLLPKQGVNIGAANYLNNVTKIQKGITGSQILGRSEALGTAGKVLRGTARAGVNVGAEAVKLPGRLGRGVEYLGTAAQRASATPRTTLGIEAVGAVGSGQGAYLAEAYAPGDPLARFIGELSGGFVGTLPSLRLAAKLGTQGVPGEGIISRFSDTAREEGVAQRLFQIVEEAAEENPAAFGLRTDEFVGPVTPEQERTVGNATNYVISRLLADDGINVPRTAAQKSGVPIMNAIEINLLRKNLGNGLSDLSNTRAENTLDSIRSILYALSQTTDDKALQKYAAVRDQYFKDILGARLSQESMLALDAARGPAGARLKETARAVQGAARAERGLREADDLDPVELGTSLRNAAYTVLGEARDQERQLWKQVDDNIEIDSTDLLSGYQKLLADLSEAKQGKVPSEMKVFFNKLEEAAEESGEAATAALPKVPTIAPDVYDPVGKAAVREAQQAIDEAKGVAPALAKVTSLETAAKENGASQMTLDTLSRARVMLSNMPDVEAAPTNIISSVGDLRKFRSDMLDLARDYRSGTNPDSKMARMAGNLAEETNKVLDKAEGKGKAYDDARAFSRALNDVFRRSFVGEEVTSKKPTGDFKNPPEILIEKVLMGSASRINLRMEQMSDAVRFMADNNIATTPAAKQISEEAFTSLIEAESGILRLAAANKVFDRQTGQVNPAALKQFLNKNEKVMRQNGFNALADDLNSVEKATILFKQLEDQNSVFNSALNKSVTFRDFVGQEDAGTAIGRALGEPDNRPVIDGVSTPAKNFKNLLRFVNRSDAPENVKPAFYDAMLHNAFVYAGGNGENFSFRKMQNYLFQPVAKGEDSPIAMMEKAGIVSRDDVDRLNALFKISGTALRRKGVPGEEVPDLELMSVQDATEDALVRLVGAGFGPKVLRFMSNLPVVGGLFEQTTGGSLVAANIGSEQLRNFFEQMPRSMMKDLWNEVAQNPDFAAEMLEKGAKLGIPKKAPSFREQFTQGARKATPFDATARTSVQQALPAYLERSLTEQEMQAPAPAPRPTPQVIPAPAPAPASVAPPQAAAPSPQTRQRMSALFPNDPVLGSSQGIASLMG